LPAELADQSIEEGEWALALLALHRPAIEQLKQGSREFLAVVPQLRRDEVGERLLGGRHVPLKLTHDLAEELLRVLSGFDLAKRLLAVEGHVLGAYFPPQRKWHTVKPPYIELYWAVIGLIAQLIGASATSLTVVVLAHELAHAFTQVGADIEGYRWEPEIFHGAEIGLKEGIAQYYTAKVCERLERLAPDAKATYETLLEKQPDAYRTHIPWLNEHKEEEVRLALVQARRSNVTAVNAFDELLKEAKAGLRTGQAASSRQ
jgi:hypothetical protein